MLEPQLFHGDCLEILAELPDKSVDLVVNDPPYGTTSLKWDEVLDFEEVWLYLMSDGLNTNLSGIKISAEAPGSRSIDQ